MSIENHRPTAAAASLVREKANALFVTTLAAMSAEVPQWGGMAPVERIMSAASTAQRRIMKSALDQALAEGVDVKLAADAGLIALAELLGGAVAVSVGPECRREAFRLLVTAFAEAAKLHEAV